MSNGETRQSGDLMVGLMSGTSLDGITAAVARFAPDGARVRAELVAHSQRPFSPEERVRLEDAMQGGTARDYCRLSVDFAGWCVEAAEVVLGASGVSRGDVRAVVSHGQTLWHEPGHSTWQIGQPAVLAEQLGLDVISDVRARDMAAGGQGAPLASTADVLCFAHDTGRRALQNIGGIGNVTVVAPPESNHAPFAFDTGPGVIVVDGVVRKLVPTLPYDVDGQLARLGVVIDDVVAQHLGNPWFAITPPKSTGRELFTPEYIDMFVSDCRQARSNATDSDIVATAVAFTAATIADQYARFIADPLTDVVISGGGAANPALFDAVSLALHKKLKLPADSVRRFGDVFFDGEAKEAVAFALLGWLHLQQRAGNIPDATGASGGRLLGSITPGGLPSSRIPQAVRT